MAVQIEQQVDELARTIILGSAPATQSGTGGQWATAWSKTGVSAQHKANAANAAETWLAVKYTDLLATTLGGGDVYMGDLGVSGQSAATSSVKQEIDGAEALRFTLAESARSVSLNLSNFFINDDGTGFVEAARVRLFDAAGKLVGEQFVQADSLGGTRSVQLTAGAAFRYVELSAGTLRADGSFAFGAYTNAAGGFGADIFTDARAVKHGSDFLVDSITFHLARPVGASDAHALDEDAGLLAFASVLANDLDAEGRPLSAVLGRGTANGSLNLNADGSFSYRPAADFYGDDSFTYRAFNGKDYSDEVTVHLTVRPVNDAPVTAPDSASVAEDSTVSIDVLANDVAGPANESAQALAVTKAGAAHGSVTVGLDGRLQYTPDADYSGSDTITYTVTDAGGASAGGSVAVTVTTVNDAPVAVNDSAATDEDTALAGNVLSGANGGRDGDVDGDLLAVTSVGTYTTALGASVTLAADGSFAYNPAVSSTLQALAAGASATDRFAYTVSDGKGATSTAHVDVVVAGKAEPVSEPPPPQPTKGLGSSLGPDADLTYYLRYNGGKWVEIESFSVGAGSEATPRGGASAVPGALSATLGTGAAASDFLKAMWSGQEFDTVELQAYLPSDKGSLVLVEQYTLQDSHVLTLQTAGAGSALSTVSFDYDILNHTLAPLTTKGLPGTPAGITWDVEQHTVRDEAKLSSVVQAAQISNQPAGLALEYYARVNGEGAWVPLQSFSMGYDTGVNPQTGEVGRAASTGLSFSLGMSQTLTTLFELVADGTGFDKLEIESYAFSGKAAPVLVDDYIFSNLGVTSLASNDSTANTVSVVYDRYTHTHADIGAVKAGQPAGEGFDQVTNKLLTAPAPSADALARLGVATSIEPTLDLTYYLRYDGGKWIEVNGFSVAAASSALAGGTEESSSTAGEFSTSLGSGPAVSDFLKKLWSGQSAGTVELQAYAPQFSGAPRLVQQYTLEQSQVLSVLTTGTGDATTGSVNFGYASLNQTVVAPDGRGGFAAPVGVTWDLAADRVDREVQLAPPVLAQQLSYQPAAVQLEYYVRVGGAGDWVPLSGFSMGYHVPVSTGGLPGKPEASGLSFDIGMSKTLTTLFKDMVSGSGIGMVEVESYTMSTKAGERVLVDDYIFTDVGVAGLASAGAASNTVSLVYDSYTHSHGNYYDGKSASLSSEGYDRGANRVLSAPAPRADALGKLGAVTSLEPGADLTYYLRYGDSDWIEVDGFSVGGMAGDAAGSGGIAKAVPGDFGTTLGVGSGASDLLQMLWSGSEIDRVELQAYRPDSKGMPMLVEQYTLSDSLVSSVQTLGSGGATHTTVHFAYETLNQTLRPLDSKGSFGTPVGVTWDLLANKVYDEARLSSPVQSKEISLQPVDVALEYYVRIDGVGQWLRLENFAMGYEVAVGIGEGGHVAAKPASTGTEIGLGMNTALLAILDTLVGGTVVASVEVEAYRTTAGVRQMVDEYIFNDVRFTSLARASATANTAALSFDSYTHTHLDYEGSRIVASSDGYDLEQAVIIAAPPVVADVLRWL